ncbi:MAG: tyrosine-type recombinase/integrase [Candidatus Woesearchaeota archaeon]
MKTSTEELIPLSEQAVKYLGKRTKSKGRVFSLPNNNNTNNNLVKLSANAGLNKNLSFHMARHTFATLSLTYGADIYTVSKLLGHTDIKHTQIYARVIDKKKEEAVDMLPRI